MVGCSNDQPVPQLVDVNPGFRTKHQTVAGHMEGGDF